MITALHAARLLTPTETIADGVVVIEDGRILAAGPRNAVTIPAKAHPRDLGPVTLAPGFVDIHVHGGAGFDFMAASPAELDAITRHLARHGVTSFCPTTVTAGWSDTLAAVERLAPVSLGVHLEGPFLSPRQRGVHPESELLEPTPQRLQQLLAAASGHLRLITLAPELPGAAAFIAAATAAGVRVSLGHTDATLEQAQAAIAAGACHLTHTFNAMRPLHHREPGVLGALLDPAAPLGADVIADGIHVHPLLIHLFYRLTGPNRAVLISDAISATGRPPGRYPLGSLTVEVAGGRCLLADGSGRLAGSVLTLDQAVRNLTKFASIPLAAAVRCATLNPARLLGLARKGRLAPGADADLVALLPGYQVLATYIAGQQVH